MAWARTHGYVIFTHDLDFELLQVTGVGLAPVSAAVLPGPFRGISHTVVWALRKRIDDGGPGQARTPSDSTKRIGKRFLALRDGAA